MQVGMELLVHREQRAVAGTIEHIVHDGSPYVSHLHRCALEVLAGAPQSPSRLPRRPRERIPDHRASAGSTCAVVGPVLHVLHDVLRSSPPGRGDLCALVPLSVHPGLYRQRGAIGGIRH